MSSAGARPTTACRAGGKQVQERVRTDLPFLQTATDQVPAAVGRARVRRLILILPGQSEINIGQRTARHRGAWKCGSQAGRGRIGRPAHWHGAPEQRDRGEDGEQPGIALGAIPACAGGVLRKSVLRSRRCGLRSLSRERNHDGRSPRAGPRWHGCEISPAYCDVILRRIEHLAETEPVLAETGEKFSEVAAGRGVFAAEGADLRQRDSKSIRRKPNGMPCYGAKGKP